MENDAPNDLGHDVAQVLSRISVGTAPRTTGSFLTTASGDGTLDVDFRPEVEDPEIDAIGGIARDCLTSSLTWQNTSFPSQEGIFTAEFDALPNDPNMDGVTALSPGPGSNYSDFAVLVCFNQAGNIDARDGDIYAADTVVAYTPGTWYHFRLVVDVPAHSYSVYVTPEGGVEEALATDYAFRTEQNDVVSLDNWGLIAEIGSHEVCNFAIHDCSTSSPTWQNTSFPSQEGIFTAEFDALPNDPNMDGVTALSAGPGAGFSDFAVLVRFNDAGYIDARDGDAYAADATEPYAPGTWYHFRLAVDISTHSYSVYVTPEGGDEQALATDYAFRAEQSDVASLDNWGLIAEIGSHEICDFAIRTVQNVTQGTWHVTIQDAIDATSPGDEIVLSAGTFTGDGNRDLDFGGRAITVRSMDPNDPDLVAATIIDCQGTGSDPHRGFYFHSGETVASVVSGLTIANGHAGDGAHGDPNSPDGEDGGHGGAIYCSDSSPTIVSCVISGNSAGRGGSAYDYPSGLGGNGGNGGAIYCSASSPTIAYCVISESSAGAGGWGLIGDGGGAGGNGGGICCDSGGEPTITNCTISENSAGPGGWGALFVAGSGDGGNGGGMHFTSVSNVTIQDCTIRGNSAGAGGSCYYHADGGGRGGSGGALFCTSAGSSTIADCTVSENAAGEGGEALIDGDGGQGGDGGGIYWVGDLTIIDCLVARNTAGNGGPGESSYLGGPGGAGGGVHCVGALTIANCAITGNTSGSAGEHRGGGNGGGICCPSESSTTITDCTISGNRAGSGGDGYVAPPGGNGGAGGGVYCAGGPTIADCTITENTSGAGGGAPTTGGEGGSGGGVCCGDSATIMNCMVSGNCAGNGGPGPWPGAGEGGSGGGICCGDNVAITSCSIVRNIAGSGGTAQGGEDGEDGSGGGLSCGSASAVTNCVVWANVATADWQVAGSPVVSYSCVDGSFPGTGNIDVYPRLTPDGHLRVGSPCIDAGDPNFVADPNNPFDIDSDARVSDGRVDMGADEFLDTDHDGLADWWEIKYFNPNDATPGADPDGDSLTNLQEYELYAGNPIASPLHVDDDAPDDPGPGDPNTSDPLEDGTLAHPFDSIQEALDLADDGDAVLVASGTYSGSGNRELDYQGRLLVVLAPMGPEATTIDLQDSGRAIEAGSITRTFAVLEGFTVTGGSAADLGGGMLADRTRMMLKNCVFEDNSAGSEGGGIYSYFAAVTFDDLTLGNNSAPAADAGKISASSVELEAPLRLAAGTLEVQSSWLDGPGAIVLDASVVPNVLMRVTGDEPGDPPTVILTNVLGTGNILIDAGQQLHITNGALVDLSGRDPNDPNGPCADPNSSTDWGTITILGSMVVRDSTVRNSNVEVLTGDIGDGAVIYNNEIDLLQNPPGWGGEFYIEGTSTIQCNVVRSEGDRYLDLDPDSSADPRPFVSDNKFFVTIKQGTLGDQGELLELRTQDFDYDPNDGASGAYELANSIGYEDTWALERLETLSEAKVNLTNRPGFVFQDPNIDVPEAMYVRQLKMYPGSVLNTALQRLYYQELVDENGDVLDPPDPNGLLANGARIVDVPLLGFSLKIIAMEDDNEFAVRIRTRLRDPDDLQPGDPNYPGDPNDPPLEGAIERIDDPLLGGVMEMRTQRPPDPNDPNDLGGLTASSVATKGAFARAGEERVTVAFDYLFTQESSDPNRPTEMVVYLSDSPEVSTDLVEVARVYPPANGPGSIGSDEMARFHGTFPSGDLNFRRGTYVELELRGQNVIALIDNFDPAVECTATCGDLDGSNTLDDLDLLMALANFGQGIGGEVAGACLDASLSSDGYVDLADMLAWDALLSGAPLPCGTGLDTLLGGPGLPDPVTPPAGTDLLVAGKPGLPGLQEDYLYALDASGGCLGDVMRPASSPDLEQGYRANARLARDAAGSLYQIHALQGLIRLDTGEVIVGPSEQVFNEDTVYVGINMQGGPYNDFLGLPFADVAFHPSDPDVVFVVPVVVEPDDFDPYAWEERYRAAVRLRLTGGGSYTIEELYGIDPHDDPELDAWPPSTATIKVQWLREVELDTLGNVYVTSAYDSHDNEWGGNDWVLTYPVEDGQAETRINISDTVPAPTALLVSQHEPDTLYVSSSVDEPPDAQTRIWKYTIDRTGDLAAGLTLAQTITLEPPSDGSVDPNDIARITSLAEDANDGTLYALGFAMPRFPDGYTSELDDPIFTVPTLAVIPAGTPDPVTAMRIECHDLAFPISLLSAEGSGPDCPGDLDGDGDVDLADLAQLLGNYGMTSGATYEDGDLDGDGDVDLADLAALLGQYGEICE